MGIKFSDIRMNYFWTERLLTGVQLATEQLHSCMKWWTIQRWYLKRHYLASRSGKRVDIVSLQFNSIYASDLPGVCLCTQISAV